MYVLLASDVRTVRGISIGKLSLSAVSRIDDHRSPTGVRIHGRSRATQIIRRMPNSNHGFSAISTFPLVRSLANGCFKFSSYYCLPLLDLSKIEGLGRFDLQLAHLANHSSCSNQPYTTLILCLKMDIWSQR